MGLVKPVSPVLQRGHPLARGLTCGVAFSEGAGGSAYDLSGRGNNGSSTGAWQGGPDGYALHTNGSTTQVTFADTASLAVWAGDFTVTCRFSMATIGSYAPVFDKGTAGGFRDFSLFLNALGGASTIYWQVGNTVYSGAPDDGISLGFTVAANTWYEFTITRTLGTTQFYVNGIFRNSLSSAVSNHTGDSANSLSLGGNPTNGGTNQQPANYSHCALWNRALSSAEVAQLYFDPFAIYRKPSRWWEAGTSGGGNVYSVSTAESSSASDGVSDIATLIALASEAGSASDVTSDTAALVALIAESGSAADVSSNIATLLASIIESASAADFNSNVATLGGIINENGSALDSVSDVAVLLVSIAEAASAADTISTGGAIYAVSITEADTISDAVSETLTILALVAESGTAADVVSAIANLVAVIAESGVAIDAETATMIANAAVVEGGNAVDLTSAQAFLELIPTRIYGLIARFIKYGTVASQVVYGSIAKGQQGDTVPLLSDLPAIAPDQVQTMFADLGNFLPAGVFLSNPVLTLTSPSDTVAQSRIALGPTVATIDPANGGTGKANTGIVWQMAAGCVPWATYLAEIKVARSDDSDMPVFWTHFLCEPPH